MRIGPTLSPGNPKWRRRISTIDLLVLAYSTQLPYVRNLFYQLNFLTVLSLPIRLEFLALTHLNYCSNKVTPAGTITEGESSVRFTSSKRHFTLRSSCYELVSTRRSIVDASPSVRIPCSNNYSQYPDLRSNLEARPYPAPRGVNYR